MANNNNSLYYKIREGCPGVALLINNERFSDNTKYEDREGSEKDLIRLTCTLKILGFNVEQFEDLTASEIQSKMVEYGEKDYSDDDCFMCVIMSHGEEDSIIGSDTEPVKIDELRWHFENNETLLDKPKLFFFQACRGTQEMQRIEKSKLRSDGPRSADNENKPSLTKADILSFYATVKGFYAYRDEDDGSPFIQELCNGLEKHADLQDILLHVKNKVSAEVSQMPTIEETLRKKIRFPKLDKGSGRSKSIKASNSFISSVIESPGGRYEGGLKNKMPHGNGTKTWENGDRYEGDWKNGKRDGVGILVYGNGDRYEGEFVQDMKHGRGRLTYGEGKMYQGEFKNDRKDGEGTMSWNDGDKYVGMWVQDEGNGKGIYYFRNGDMYVGEFRNGVPEGVGTLKYRDGKMYEGQFRSGRKNGMGKMTWPDGDRYEGSFRDDEGNGLGTYYFNSGERFEGEFQNGLRNGKGTLVLKNQKRFVRVWKPKFGLKI